VADGYLSNNQKRVLGTAVRAVEAGPGSGKTRALVARFVQTANRQRGGVAFLSFTNAAIDEVRQRTGGATHLLKAPHFVGTIDSFLHRFVVTPADIPRLGKSPSYLASWADLGEDQWLRLQDVEMRSRGISLSSFLMDERGRVDLAPGLNQEQRAYLAAIDAAGQREQLRRYATRRIVSYNNAGVWDSNTARVKAWQLLGGPAGQAAIARLGRRFCEFLVDEAQDCDAPEINILRRLATVSHVVLVADPDQAIFEFRGGQPELFCGYRDELLNDNKRFISLNVNHRSTGAICEVISALRAASQGAIEAADRTHHGAPVLVLAGTPPQQRAKFEQALADAGIPTVKAAVLAHRASTVRAVLGHGKERQTQAAGNHLARACTTLRSDATSVGERLEALETVERLVLSLFDWAADEGAIGTRRRLELLERRPEWLRVIAARLVGAVNDCSSAQEFGTTARRYLDQALTGSTRELVPLGARLQKPDDAHWTAFSADAVVATRLGHATVHSAKGKEYDAVLLALPKGAPHDGLEDWEAGENSEARRVLYVGASRARHLLAFGAGAQATRVAELLRAHRVDVVVR
jgi:superfamily I DNA/RNA helicase